MKLARNSFLVGAGAGVSRVLGFARDMAMAALLGSGPLADAFVVAFRLPNLFRRLLSEGAMNGVFVPLHAQARRDGGPQGARLFAGQALSAITLALLVILFLGQWRMDLIVGALAPGFADDPAQMQFAVLLARICFPFLLFSVVTAILVAVMNSEGRFRPAVYGPIAFNCVLIGGFLAIHVEGLAGLPRGAIWLAIAVAAAGFAQLVLTFIVLRRLGLGFRPRWPRWTPGFARFALLIGPGLLVGGISHINAFVGTIVGSASPSIISWLYYADRVYQLPLGIVGVAVGIVVLPDLTRRIVAGDHAGAIRLQNGALLMGMALAAPAAAALFVLAEPIVDVLFRRGLFDSAAAIATAQTLAAFSLGLPGYVAAKALQPSFFARHDMRTPLIAALIGAAFDIGLAIALFPVLEHVGIALAASAAGWINALLLAGVLMARGTLAPDRELLARLARTVLATLGMALGLVAAMRAGQGFFTPEQGIVLRTLALGALCLGGLVLYLALARAFGILDAAALLRRIRDKQP